MTDRERRSRQDVSELLKRAVAGAPPVSAEVKARIRDLMPPVPPARWSCPNDPPCPYPGVLHDVYDHDDERPTCCADGCRCGRDSRNGRERL